MVKNYKNDDTFLGRWIAGRLSEEERIAFEKSEEFKIFDAINRESQLLDGPDIDTDKALEAVKEKIRSGGGKISETSPVVFGSGWSIITYCFGGLFEFV